MVLCKKNLGVSLIGIQFGPVTGGHNARKRVSDPTYKILVTREKVDFWQKNPIFF